MFKCNDCGKKFEGPKVIHTSYESYYGVASDFLGSTPMTLKLCPYCESESFNELTSEDEEKENILEELDNLDSINEIQDFCEQEERLTFEIETCEKTKTIYVAFDGFDIFEKEFDINGNK